MLRNCEPRLLFEEENFFISQCHHCQRINLSFNNLLLGFNSKEFETLSNLILKLEFHKHCMNHQDGSPKIILNTGHKDIQCCFSQQEFRTLKTGLTESLLLLKAQAILNHHEL